MNAEVSKIRKERNLKDERYGILNRLSEEEVLETVKSLNSNLAELTFFGKQSDVNDFVDTYIENIYIILDVCARMNLFPDYFFDLVMKKNVGYKGIENRYLPYDSMEIKKKIANSYKAELQKNIEYGIENMRFKLHASGKRNINDTFVETASFYQKYQLPIGELSDKPFETLKRHDVRFYRYADDLVNADDVVEEVESLVNMIFEYLSCFVELGINPTEILNKCIEEKFSKKMK